MSSQLELLTRILVLVNRSQDSNYFLACRKRDRTCNSRAVVCSCLYDLLGCCVNYAVLVALDLDPYLLICCHDFSTPSVSSVLAKAVLKNPLCRVFLLTGNRLLVIQDIPDTLTATPGRNSRFL